MSLKRGLERESCDFCFRRKIKCDRSSRAVTGRPVCSQCDLRQTPCTFGSDDVRLPRRRKNSPKRGLSNVGPGINTPIGIKPQQQISHGVISSDGWTRARNSAVTTSNDMLPPTIPDSFTIPSRLSLGNGTTTTTPQSRTTTMTTTTMTTFSLPTYRDLEFELSPEGTSVLDSIFLQSHDISGYTINRGNTPTQALQFMNEPQDNTIATKNPYCDLDTPPETLDVAIEAYFSFASVAIPILSKDGFMTDYKGHRSSTPLVCAVACRGCPFIQSTEKWTMQQRFASRFRETFLEARSSTLDQDVVRLDDLEALALMVDFKYEGVESFTTPLQSQLQNLLLTNDSLVLMALQYRIETCPAVETGVPTTLSRAAQRQTLLFWYVYGWDAFCCIDRKMASRIRDEDIDLSVRPHGFESLSYFDAILGLATIARKMARALCGPVARRKGVKHHEIENIYKQLEEWRTNICPSALKIQYSDHISPRRERTLSLGKDVEEFLPLHKAIVALLELSCFMQLEACVSQYGIEDRDSLSGQIIVMRVRYESLQAAYKIVEVAQWIEKLTVGERMLTSTSIYAMADLAPVVIRNICAGMSNWIFLTANETLQSTAEGGPELTVGRSDHEFSDKISIGSSRERGRSWVESLTTLRNIVATSTSHRDTECMLERIDQQLESLKISVNIHV
ncbi:hypothetical protein F4782DRAFT_496939 [Xylaria castorea]|nr:hypothetical protein F4782DRAFT_496939 [Xylaria castorea]